MYLTSLALKNFRCFQSIELVFNKKLIVIEGPNGSGKTSLLEAIYYVCYGRSFRTRIVTDFIANTSEAFVIKIQGSETQAETWDIHVGGTATKRLLKINNRPATSYKELVSLYRVISITEDDVMMIKGAPELRRLFIDQALLLQNPDYNKLMKSYRHIVSQRNSALWRTQQQDDASLSIWTQKLQEQSKLIQQQRTEFLMLLEQEVNILNQEFIDTNYFISLRYSVKENNPCNVWHHEQRLKRTLFGAHLDDMSIEFQHLSSRTHASRGQQKLIALLLKVAQLRILKKPSILLLDDFLTDFDSQKASQIIQLVNSLECQVIITTPLENYINKKYLSSYDHQHVILTIANTDGQPPKDNSN